MGAWGVGIFDNDDACDWKYGLEKTSDLRVVEAAIAAVNVGEDGYVEAPSASEALAACEVIARLKGNWGARNSYTETLDKWVEAHPMTPGPQLVASAMRVIDRILAANSELLELWKDSEEYEDWLKAVQDLRQRVLA
jgi:hypothetical protein